MKLIELHQKPDIDKNIKLQEAYIEFEKLLLELREKDLPDGLVLSINKDIEELNASSSLGDELRKIIKKIQTKNIKLLEKEIKLVPRNYYRKLWTALGMASFGIPLGAVLGASLGNMALIGIGMPIGLALGSGVGSIMDKKAFKEGRQLDVEIKH